MDKELIPYANAIAEARPKFLKIAEGSRFPLRFEEEARFALQIVEGSKKLQQCDPSTVYNSVLNVASIGLTLNPVNQHAYLIPRWSAKLRTTVCTVMPGYRGLARLAKALTDIETLDYQLVWTGDRFVYRLGLHPDIEHEPAAQRPENAEIEHAYAYAFLRDARLPIVKVMTAGEIEHIASYSEAYNPSEGARKKGIKPSGPWIDHRDQMSLKTVLKQLLKKIPQEGETELGRAIKIDDDAERDEMAKTREEEQANVIDGEELLLISKEELAELRNECKAQRLKQQIVCEAYAIKKLADLPSKYLPEVRAKLKARAAELAKKAEEKSK